MSARITTGQDSKQDYGTPLALFRQIQKHFDFGLDLAAHGGNHKCERWYGRGGEVEDCFSVPWMPLEGGKWYWLNPEYSDIAKWYRPLSARPLGSKVVSLVPMDSAAAWFDFVPGHAGIWHLQGRIKFDGADQSCAKDCALHIWDKSRVGEFRVWNWKKDKFLI